MKFPRSCLQFALALLVGAGLGVAPASADGVDDFQLLKAVPADVVIATGARTHEGQAFVTEQYQKVWKKVQEQRFDRDLRNLFRDQVKMQGGDLDAFDAQWTQFSDLFLSVEWQHLAAREFAFGMRMGLPSFVEYVELFKPEADTVAADFQALSEIAKSLVGLAPEAFMITTDDARADEGIIIHKIVPAAGSPMPIMFTLARHNETIMFAFGPQIGEQVLAMLGGETGESIVAADRFKEAVGKLPVKPQDFVSFIDAQRGIAKIREFAAMMNNAPLPPEDSPYYESAKKGQELPGALIDLFDMFDYMVATSRTDGMRTDSYAVAHLAENAKDSLLYKPFFGVAPLEKPLSYIPKEAGGFTVVSAVDIYEAYKAVITFVREHVPDGAENVDEGLAEARVELGMDLEQDIFSWMEGRFVTFDIPGKRAYDPANSVFMISVHDAAKASSFLNTIVDRFVPKPDPDTPQQWSLDKRDLEHGKGFYVLKWPMLAMMQIEAPTIGVADDWLIIGTSPTTIDLALATAKGESDNITKNERFLAEGLTPEGAVSSVSFSDLTKWHEELGTALAMVGMFQGMMPPEVRNDPSARLMLSTIAKSGNIIRAMDFFQSTASVTTIADGGRTYLTHARLTYREPKKPGAGAGTASQ